MAEFSPTATVDPAVSVRTWVKRLRLVLALTAALSVPPLLIGAWLFLDDASETTDDWHGLGMLFGGLLVVGAVVLAGLALLLRRLVGSGLTRTLSGNATHLRVVCGVVIAGGVLVTLPAANVLGVLFGPDASAGLLGLPTLAVGVALVVCGVGAFRSAAGAAAAATVPWQGALAAATDQWLGYGPPPQD